MVVLDNEQAQEAQQQARAMAARDPDAAQFLMTHVQATPSRRTPYDPMRLYARMGRFYAWMSKDVIDAMDHRTFFGYVREANLINEQEERAFNSPQATNEQAALSQLERPIIYEGEVVPYGR